MPTLPRFHEQEAAEWLPTVPLERLPEGGRTVVRAGSKRIALFRGEGVALHAVDDQCPHEGYPLSKGSLCGDVLTCCYHNFKFDIRSGACTKGDESVSVHNTRIRDGQIEVQLATPARAIRLAKHRRSLDEALREYRLGQAARETVRLLSLGETPVSLALFAAQFDAEYGEYGCTHALPVAADVCSLLSDFPGTSAALPLMQALELASDSSVRRPKRPSFSEDPGENPDVARELFRAHVEAERAQEAEALLRGALQKGWARSIVEPWLLEVSTAHFLDFGHGLIFTVKAFDLLEVAGYGHAVAILPGLVATLVNGTREDATPEWRWFGERMAGVGPKLDAWWAAQTQREAGEQPWGEAEQDTFVAAVLDGSREAAFDAVGNALERHVPVVQIVDGLSAAASMRILRFNVAIDSDSTVQEGWLDVTHLLTFVNAARHALGRCTFHLGLKWLFQASRFINAAKPLDIDEPHPKPHQGPLGVHELPSLDSLGVAVRARHVDVALDLTRRHLSGGNVRELETWCRHLVLEDRATSPIFAAHLIKTCLASFDESRRIGRDSWKTMPVLAFINFAASPVRERQLARLVHEAVRFVDHGKVPRKLT